MRELPCPKNCFERQTVPRCHTCMAIKMIFKMICRAGVVCEGGAHDEMVPFRLNHTCIESM